MADLKDTTIRGDLSVEGSITPWGGSQEGFAYIGYTKKSVYFRYDCSRSFCR